MPWTFAHPAAVLPLRQLCPRWLSLPALVLGSLIPDLGYYVGLVGVAGFVHTLPGLLLVGLPLGLLLLALMTRFNAQATVLLPAPHRQLFRHQLQSAHLGRWRTLATTAASLLLGAATHLLWDSFTHDGRWGVSLWTALNQEIGAIGGRRIHVFNVLQHLSTALGLTALAMVYQAALCSPEVAAWCQASAHEARRMRWLLIMLGLAVATGTLVATALALASSSTSVTLFVVRAVVWSTAGFVALYAAGSAAWWRQFGAA